VKPDEVGVWRYRSVARSDRGRVRARNEDVVVDRPEVGVWAVADGMGGHDRGDRASGIVKEELARLRPSAAGLDGMVAAVRDSLSAAHARLRAEFGSSGSSGTTVVVLVVEDDRYVCLWAGDSRLYRCAHGTVERLTTDHSLVQELVSSGAITPQAAQGHPLANRITRAVGVEPTLDLEMRGGRCVDGERFLLSSDGLHGLVDDEAVARLATINDLDAAAEALISAALEAGGTDNVSLVLVAVENRRHGGASGRS
jgi:serine/threonine protein phosphatase PrpC